MAKVLHQHDRDRGERKARRNHEGMATEARARYLRTSEVTADLALVRRRT
jgi:hypothetical protein